MVQSPAIPLTLEAFLTLPETKPASEYSDGKVIQKSMPQGKHSTLQTELCISLNAVLKPRKVARAFAELRCTFGERSIVPDIAVFTWARIPRDPTGEVANVFSLPPDWIIEILSPDQSALRVTKNILHCLEYGTQLGWLIDPKERALLVYCPSHLPQVFERPEQSLPVPDFATGLILDLRAVFACLVE